jgi:hypothetical protein
MLVIGIDPANVQSAYCHFDGEKFMRFDILPNKEFEYELVEFLKLFEADMVYIEGIQHMGMPAGASVFETAYEVGRISLLLEQANQPYKVIYRKDVKMHHCQSMRAKDANIRQALIDRFGAPGTKKAPGGTYGIKADIWSAAAISVMAYDHLHLNK